MARDKRTGTGSARELMDRMRRLMRLRESVYVVFENARVVMEDWVWSRKYVKPRIFERGVRVDEAGLSVGGDDEAVGINERFSGDDECQCVDTGIINIIDLVLCEGERHVKPLLRL